MTYYHHTMAPLRLGPGHSQGLEPVQKLRGALSLLSHLPPSHFPQESHIAAYCITVPSVVQSTDLKRPCLFPSLHASHLIHLQVLWFHLPMSPRIIHLSVFPQPSLMAKPPSLLAWMDPLFPPIILSTPQLEGPH